MRSPAWTGTRNREARQTASGQVLEGALRKHGVLVWVASRVKDLELHRVGVRLRGGLGPPGSENPGRRHRVRGHRGRPGTSVVPASSFQRAGATKARPRTNTTRVSNALRCPAQSYA